MREVELGVLKLELPVLHIPLPQNPRMQSSPEHPSTPPVQTTPASVPFRWEDEPGKPRSSCCITPLSQSQTHNFKLELPPGSANKFTGTPSPTTVLDGPCNVGRPKFSSFRWFQDYSAYDTSSVVSSYYSPCDDGSVGVEELFECKKVGRTRKGFFGRIKNGKKVVDGGSCRFSPSSLPPNASGGDSVSYFDENLTRHGSFSTVSSVNATAKPSRFLASIYQGLKQVIQRKSGRKSGKAEGSA